MTDLNQVDIEQGKVDVEIFNQTDAAMSLLSDKYSYIPDVWTREGYEYVKAGVRELTSYRTALDAERQRIKKPYLDAGRIIDAEARRITESLVALEEPMKAAKKEVDDRKKKQEAERIARLREKVDAIYARTGQARNKTSDEIAKIIEEVDAIDTMRDYYDLTREAIEAQQAVLGELSEMYNQQFRYEQEKLERERIQKEQAEQRKRQEITDRINETKMIPASLMGATAQQIENNLKRLENYSSPEGVFGDRQAEAEDARKTAIQQLENMLKQQRMVEEAQAKQDEQDRQNKMDREAEKNPPEPAHPEPKGAPQPAEPETVKQPEKEDQFDKALSESMEGPHVGVDMAKGEDCSPEPTTILGGLMVKIDSWAKKWEVPMAAVFELEEIIKGDR